MSDVAEKVRALMKEHEREFIETLKHLHRNPELSFQEYQTTAFIKEYLTALDIDILDIGLETGVIGLLKGSCDGPCIALRADIDGLPIQEESDCDYRSQASGTMHACGHDTHTASLLAAATILAALREEIHGSVKFLFQPAEELNLGAKKLMSLNVLENPKVDAIFGMHNAPWIPCGSVCVRSGPLMAAVDRIIFTICGKGGHGGIPQANVDPIVAAAGIIQAAQTVVSRNISPLDSAVLSICNVKAGEGTTNNVTPDKVKMYGTVRTFRKEVQDMVDKRLTEIARSVAEGYNCEGTLQYLRELPVTDNDPALHDAAYEAVSSVARPVVYDPTTGGEDFAVYTQTGVPGFFYWLGVGNEELGCVHPWHSPRFKADPNGIPIGGGVYAMSVFTAIEQLKNQ